MNVTLGGTTYSLDDLAGATRGPELRRMLQAIIDESGISIPYSLDDLGGVIRGPELGRVLDAISIALGGEASGRTDLAGATRRAELAALVRSIADGTYVPSAAMLPSAMVTNADAGARARFDAIPAPHGLIRQGDYNYFLGSSDQAEWLDDLENSLGPDLVARAAKGTVLLLLNGWPSWLSSVVNGAVNQGVDYAASLQLVTDMAEATLDVLHNVLGIPAPRKDGIFVPGTPGIAIEFWNEPDDYTNFWIGTQLQYFEHFKAFHDGAVLGYAGAVVLGCSVASYSRARTERLEASYSNEARSGAKSSPGGLTSVGPTSTNPLDRYRGAAQWDVSGLGADIASVSFSVYSETAAGDVSGDTLAIRPYGTDGQGDPSSDSASSFFAKCATGTAYVSGSTAFRTTGLKTIALGAQAAADVNAARAAESDFSLAFQNESEDAGTPTPPRQFQMDGYNNGTALYRPALNVVYENSMLHEFLVYCGAQGIPLDGVLFHNFQSSPDDAWADAVSAIQASLAAAELGASLPICVTEFSLFASSFARDNTEEGAAFTFYSLLTAHAAGVTALCKASLMDFDVATPDNKFLGDVQQAIGMITQDGSDVNVNKPCFQALQLLQEFGVGGDPFDPQLSAGDIANGVSAYAVRRVDGTCAMIYVRYDPGGSDEDVAVNAQGDSQSATLWQIDSAQNNPYAAFTNEYASSSDYNAAIAAATAAEVLVSSSVSLPLTLTMEKFSIAVLVTE